MEPAYRQTGPQYSSVLGVRPIAGISHIHFLLFIFSLTQGIILKS
jgi:hypothetical protein